MVITDEKELKKLSKAQLIDMVKQAELKREEWHTRLTEAVAKNLMLSAEIKSLQRQIDAFTRP